MMFIVKALPIKFSYNLENQTHKQINKQNKVILDLCYKV